jgi:protocatechuate 3,4-dioxygenase beta subunit
MLTQASAGRLALSRGDDGDTRSGGLMPRSGIHRILRWSISAALASTGVVCVAPGASADGSISVFSGVVQTSGGTSIRGVDITLEGADGESSTAVTSKHGSFAVDVAPGSYTLSLQYTGKSTVVPDFTLGGESPIDLTQGDVTQNLVLPAAVVAVHVVDSNSDPVQGATVYTTELSETIADLYPGLSVSGYLSEQNSLTTDQDGDVDVPVLIGAGSGTGSVYPPPGNTTPTFFTIPAITAPTTDVAVQLVPTFTFSGVVETSSGAPVRGVTVTLDSLNGQVGRADVSGSDGSFAVTVASGPYSLFLQYLGHSSVVPEFDIRTTAAIDLTHGDVTQNLTIPLATVTAHVVDGNADPIENATVVPPTDMTGAIPDLYPGVPATDETYSHTWGYLTTNRKGDVEFPVLLGTNAEVGYAYLYPGPGVSSPVAYELPAITAPATDVTVQLP